MNNNSITAGVVNLVKAATLKSRHSRASLFILGVWAVTAQSSMALRPCNAEGDDGRQRLRQALARFSIDQPWRKLDDAPPYLARNRGSAAYVAGLMSSQPPEARSQIARDFAELSSTADQLPEAALAIDRERGKLYREALRFDVLRFFVEVISEGRQTFRFPATAFSEAYFSQAEGRHQLFQVVLPKDYSPEVKYPLLVQLFGSASLLPSDDYPFIRVRPSGRGVWGYRSMSRYDVLQVIAFMKSAYNIDGARVYMTGTSAGATGVMHAAALRQDVFAGLVPLVAFGNDLPLENFCNLPIRCEHGINDWTSAVCNVRVQFQRLRAFGYDAVLNEHATAGHGIRAPPPDTMRWLFQLRQDPSPKRIVHSCEHPRDGRAYWLRIEEFDTSHKMARVTAEAGAGGVAITTSNVRQLSLDLSTAPWQGEQKIVIDGTSLKLTPGAEPSLATFTKMIEWRLNSGHDPAVGSRRAYGAGAAANLFQGEPLLVVYGTGADSAGNQFLQRAAHVLARSGGPDFKPANVHFPVRSDSNLADVPLDKYNLLLVGTPHENAYLRKIAAQLPYTIDDGRLNAGERRPLSLNGAVLSFCYFNPQHPSRQVYIVSPYLDETQRQAFVNNPRPFLAGSDGFKMIDQPDLLVRGVDGKIRREMQLDDQWQFVSVRGDDRRVPEKFADRTHLAVAHMKAVYEAAEVDFALWWGPEDKGLFGGYDFNWLPALDPSSYTLADYLVRRRETETMTGVVSGEEFLSIFDRWIATRELITWPEVGRQHIKPKRRYRVVIPMDLVPKLGIRRRVLLNVAAGPAIMPRQVADEMMAP